MRKYPKSQILLSAAASVLAFALSSTTAHSQTKSLNSQAIELAKRVEKIVTAQSDSLSGEPNTIFDEIALTRYQIFKTINQEIDTDLKKSVTDYIKLSSETGTERNQETGKIFQDILSVFDKTNLFENADVVIGKIEPYKNHTDWFVASQAYIYSSQFYSYKRDYITALEEANHALDLMPQQLDPYVTEVKLYATDIIAYLHNLQNNTDLAIKTSEDLVDLRIQSGVSVTGIVILNNLMYSLGEWRDHETGKALAEVLLRLEAKTQNTTPGLTHLRVAQVSNELGQYNSALNNAQKSLTEAKNSFIIEQANTESAISYAGLGLTDAAIKSLEKNGPRLSYEELISNTTSDDILFAEALIAINKGDEAASIRLMNRRVDVNVQRILDRNTSDATTLLANLENSRERQEERETALKRETELKAAQLEAQKRTNKLLILLAGFLALATVASILFARYRNKISKKLAIQTIAAQSADKMKSEFLGMVSHELRTPLNGIIGIADLLANHHKDDDVRKKTKIILDAGNDLTRMVESIIDMSYIDGGNLPIYSEQGNPYGSITSEIALWEREAVKKGLTFTAFIDKTINQEMNLDVKRFTQCLTNLLSNAVKFTDTGRIHLHMTALMGENTDIQIQTIIADTGQGITELVQSKLFMPFLQADSSMTRKHGGAGLNLAITRAIARMMDGDVTLVSNSGRGSEFTFTVNATLVQSSAAPATVKTILHLDEVETAPKAPLETSEPVELDLETPEAEIPKADISEVEVSNLNKDTLDVTALVTPELPTAKTELDAPNTDEANPDKFDINEPELPENTLDVARPTADINFENLHGNTHVVYAEDDNVPDSPAYKDSLSGLKVLIVDDMATNRDIIRMFLDPAGSICLEAENGAEALEVLTAHDIDVILMDLRMPIMDGIETTKIIRKTGGRHKDIPIIALTADSTPDVNAQCLSIGMDMFLAKPVISADLTESILFLLRQRQKNHLRALAVG